MIRCFIIFFLVGFSLAGCSKPENIEIQSSNTLVSAKTLELAEAEVSMEVVNAYYAILRLSNSIDPILVKSAVNPISIDQNREEFLLKISQANELLVLADQKALQLPPIVSGLGGEERQRAIAIRALIPQIQTAATEKIVGWERQFGALVEGDVEKYHKFLASETDQSVLLIEAANVTGRAKLLAIDDSAPAYNLQEAIVLGNETVVSFLKFLQNFETNTSAEDAAATADIGRLVESIRITIDNGMNKVADAKANLEAIAISEVSAIGSAFFDCLQMGLNTEKEILSHLNQYHNISEELASHAFDEDSQRRLGAAELSIQKLSMTRSATKTECYRLSLAYMEEINLAENRQ